MEQLLSPKALAAMLGIAEQTIYNRYSKGGDLPIAVKLGRLLRFRTSDIEAWLDQKQSTAIQPTPTLLAIPRRRGRPSKVEQIAARG